MQPTGDIDINGLRNGDERQWHRLFSTMYPLMCRVAFGYVHDKSIAESIADDVMVHLWETRDNLSIKVSMQAYLVRATKNKCLDYLNSRYYRKTMSFSSVESGTGSCLEFLRLVSEDDGGLLERGLDKEVIRALDDLPDKTRDVFLQCRVKRKRYSEIAAEIGVSENTVKYHMKQALALLRVKLAEYLPCLAFLMAILKEI